MRPLLGFLAVTLLKILGRVPTWLLLALGNLLLPFYVPFRRRTRLRLDRIDRAGRIAMHPDAYYRMRLRLTLLSLKHLLGRPDGCEIHIEGREHFQAALGSGRPVVVLGWHQGPVELLHRIPQEEARLHAPDRAPRPFFLLTAKAFAPALTDLMKRGREGTRKEILHPHSLSGLKRWEKEKGILAMMVDQVPGKPEEWLAPLDGLAQIPFPGKLLDWLAGRDAEFLMVSVRLEKDDRIFFRYDPVDARLLREDIVFHLDRALRAAPGQYNWSYPKIQVH